MAMAHAVVRRSSRGRWTKEEVCVCVYVCVVERQCENKSARWGMVVIREDRSAGIFY